MPARWIAHWGGPLLRGDQPRPVAGRGEVLIAVEACGVGLTVLNCIRGDLTRGVARTPRIPGHEYVGRIVAVGPGVDRDRIGERVMAYFYLFCGDCRHCVAGRESLCERLTGFVGVDIDGGYAPLAALPARNAVPLPAGIDAVAATAIPDAIATPVHVAARADIGPGDRVVVIGAGGGVGVHMLQVARLRGAQVLGVETSATKRRWLEDELHVPTIDTSTFTEPLRWPDWTRGADVVVDLVGRAGSVRWALDATRENGRVALLTTFTDVEVPITPREMVFGQRSLIGSRYASRSELVLAAELVASGAIRPIVSAGVGPAELDDLHARLLDGTLLGRGALVWQTEHEPGHDGSQLAKAT